MHTAILHVCFTDLLREHLSLNISYTSLTQHTVRDLGRERYTTTRKVHRHLRRRKIGDRRDRGCTDFRTIQRRHYRDDCMMAQNG